jgi:hypothetical protein
VNRHDAGSDGLSRLFGGQTLQGVQVEHLELFDAHLRFEALQGHLELVFFPFSIPGCISAESSRVGDAVHGSGSGLVVGGGRALVIRIARARGARELVALSELVGNPPAGLLQEPGFEFAAA